MRPFTAFLLLSTVTVAVHAAPLPGDAATGKKLYRANCVSCHDASVYTRPDRQIHSLDALRTQINGCSHQLPVKLSQSQIDDLVKYLNQNYYKFK